MRLRSIVPLGVLAVSALALAAQAMEIKWSPKVGDKANYKIAGTFDLPGAGEIKLDGTRAEEIKSVSEDKVVAESTSNMTASVAGNEIPVPESKETLTSKPDGSLLELKIGDGSAAGGMRLARASAFIYPSKPVAVGDTWTVEMPKDEKADLPGVKIEYKLVGEEKVGDWNTWKITSKGGEIEGDQPTKVEATTWIRKENGALVRSVAQMSDAVFSAEVPPLSGKLEINRVP